MLLSSNNSILKPISPLGDLGLLLTRFFFPAGGVSAANAGLQSYTTTGIFVISGLGLRRGETLQALSSWGSVAFGMLSILLITPLAAFLALRLPLKPPELAFGLAVFCCMPTTLSSGVSLTQVCSHSLLMCQMQLPCLLSKSIGEGPCKALAVR